MMLRRLPLVAALVVATLVAAACGGNDNGPTVTVRGTTFAASLGVDLAHSDSLSTGVFFRDKVVGEGQAVVTGDTVIARYAGWLANGTSIGEDTTTPPGLKFVAGNGVLVDEQGGTLIPGFAQGVVGMHAGGRRQILIPPAEGYGSSARGDIPGNSVLVFDVIADSIRHKR